MKLLISICSLLLLMCQQNIQKQNITDAGRKQIGDNVYLQKYFVGKDRVYILVNEKNEIISGNTSTSYTINAKNTSYVKSNSFF